MENYKDTLKAIASLLNERYKGIDQISRLTYDLDDALKRNDTESIGIVMTMRSEEMDKVDTINRRVDLILERLPNEYQESIRLGSLKNIDINEVSEIIDIKKRSQRLIESIIKQDKLINKRISGSKSFYN